MTGSVRAVMRHLVDLAAQARGRPAPYRVRLDTEGQALLDSVRGLDRIGTWGASEYGDAYTRLISAEQRTEHGVYYTPVPLADAMAYAALGLADRHQVHSSDPARRAVGVWYTPPQVAAAMCSPGVRLPTVAGGRTGGGGVMRRYGLYQAPCGFYRGAGVGVCGAVPTRLFLGGHRCREHAPEWLRLVPPEEQEAEARSDVGFGDSPAPASGAESGDACASGDVADFFDADLGGFGDLSAVGGGVVAEDLDDQFVDAFAGCGGGFVGFVALVGGFSELVHLLSHGVSVSRSDISLHKQFPEAHCESRFRKLGLWQRRGTAPPRPPGATMQNPISIVWAYATARYPITGLPSGDLEELSAALTVVDCNREGTYENLPNGPAIRSYARQILALETERATDPVVLGALQTLIDELA